MQLLYERKQASGAFTLVPLRIGGGVLFTLWAKAELDPDEQELLAKYRFEDALLVADDPIVTVQRSLRTALVLGVVLWILLYLVMSFAWATGLALLAVVALTGLYYNELRESIYVRDLVHGRTFRCFSVIELLRKEEYLKMLGMYLRQVLESSKHWGGRETVALPPLAPEEARQLVVRGL